MITEFYASSILIGQYQLSSLFLDSVFRDIVKYNAPWCKIHLSVGNGGERTCIVYGYI